MASSRGDSIHRKCALIGRGSVVGLVLWPALIACGADSGSETISLPPSPTKSSAKLASAAPAPTPPAGFTPLPTPQQVVAALPTGRVDPFAPLPQAAKPVTASSDSAGDLRFTGVLRSSGQVQALVQVGEQSGPVCVGRRGVCRGSGLPALLPADWSVTSIDVTSGRLVLNQAGQRRVFSL